MKNILNKSGYSVFEKPIHNYTTEVRILSFNNRNGRFKWIWPMALTKPLFLEQLSLHGQMSSLLSFAIKVIFRLKFQKIFFRRETIYVKAVAPNKSFSLYQPWFIFEEQVPGELRTFLYHEKDGVGYFFKTAGNENSRLKLQTETRTLERLYSAEFETFHVPEIINYKNASLYLRATDTKSQTASTFGYPQLNALIELNDFTAFSMPLMEFENWNKMVGDLRMIKNLNDTRIPTHLLSRLEKLKNSFSESMVIEVCLSHGNFSPWNMLLKKHKLFIYNWENASPINPLGFDAFHYIIQHSILMNKLSWKKIKSEIDLRLTSEKLGIISKFCNTDVNTYLNLYLLLTIVSQLKIYTEQHAWSKQMEMNINIWDNAMEFVTKDLSVSGLTDIKAMSNFVLERNMY